LVLAGCSKSIFNSKWTTEKSPQVFGARFETTKGIFDIQIRRECSPYAVDRFYQLLKHRYYDNSIIYRVDSNFVVQFGSSDTAEMEKWSKYRVPDESVVCSNKKGTISFARAGKETRGSELFINLNNNQFLDTSYFAEVKGFPAFGNVTKGMDVVESMYSGYGDKTMAKLDTMYLNPSLFLHIFPRLDAITKAYIIKNN